MATDVAFLIKDLNPSEGYDDVIGVIAKVSKSDFNLKELLTEIEDAFYNEKLMGRFDIVHKPTLSTRLEEVNGVLIGCVTMTGCGHQIIEDVANSLLERSAWTGTSASPQAVATFINQMKDFDCVDPTSEWKGFYNY